MPELDVKPQPDIPNSLIWDELKYIRRKVDQLEQRLLLVSGGFAAIATAIALFELLRK